MLTAIQKNYHRKSLSEKHGYCSTSTLACTDLLRSGASLGYEHLLRTPMYMSCAPNTIRHIWNYLPNMPRRKLVVSSQKLTDIPPEFEPLWFANQLMLKSEFKDGKVAYVKYSRGKLSITVGKQPKKPHG